MEQTPNTEKVKKVIPYNMYMHMDVCTYLFIKMAKEVGIQIESERKMRNASQLLVSTEILCEAVPFSFPMKRGGEELRPAPLAYVSHIVTKVQELLEQNYK